jgi:uncharacterized protein (TIGR03435 family)
VSRTGPLFVSLLLGLMSGLRGQAQSDAPKRPEFEVASIKPHSSDDRWFISPSPGGRFNAVGATLQMLMTIAYRVLDNQISGAPGWMSSDRYDIVGKTEDGADSKWIECLQTLLEDRFKLTIHRETKEMTIYALVVAKSGSKLHESEGECPPRPPGPPPPPPAGKTPPPFCGGMFMFRNQMAGNKVPLEQLVMSLSRTLGRTVIDKTGLTGKYDVKLEWTPDQSQAQFGPGAAEPPAPTPDNSGPSIYTALQEQLGLKLESQKGPVEVLVIDHVEPPDAN